MPSEDTRVQQYRFGATKMPGATLCIGFREPTEPYARIWLRRYASDGTPLDNDVGLIKSREGLDALGQFLEALMLQIEEVGDFQDAVKRKLESGEYEKPNQAGAQPRPKSDDDFWSGADAGSGPKE